MGEDRGPRRPADVDGVAVDDVENTGALVLGVARADSQVDDVEAGRGPGRLAEQAVALGAGGAVALDAPEGPVPSLDRRRHAVDESWTSAGSAIVRGLRDAAAVLGKDDVAGAGRVPEVAAGRRRRLGPMLVEII